MTGGLKTHVDVLAAERVNLIGEDAHKRIAVVSREVIKKWRKKHQRAEIISAIPAFAQSCDYSYVLTITLLYRD